MLRFARPCLIVLAAAAVCFAGCGPKGIPGLKPVKGVVLYEGLPLPWATMTFAPDTENGVPAGGVRVSTAMTDADGRFIVGTVGRKGALPGNYIVTVEKYIANEEGAVEAWEKKRAGGDYSEPRPSNGFVDDSPSEDGKEPEAAPVTFNVVSAIPLRYAEKETSELKVAIPEKGTKDLTIELTK